MFKMLLSLLGALPGIGSLVQSIVAKVYDSKVAITTAQIGGDTAVAKEMIKGSVQANAQLLSAVSTSKVMAFIVLGFALPWMIYEWKVVVWDNVLDWGSTAAIHGNVGEWGHIIIVSIFGSGTVLSLGHMYYSRGSQS